MSKPRVTVSLEEYEEYCHCVKSKEIRGPLLTFEEYQALRDAAPTFEEYQKLDDARRNEKTLAYRDTTTPEREKYEWDHYWTDAARDREVLVKKQTEISSRGGKSGGRGRALNVPNKSQARKDRIFARREAGEKISVIADTEGVSQGYVSRIHKEEKQRREKESLKNAGEK